MWDTGENSKNTTVESGRRNAASLYETNDGCPRPGRVWSGAGPKAGRPDPARRRWQSERALAAGCSHRGAPARPIVSGPRIYKKDRLDVSRPKVSDPESRPSVDSMPSCTSSLSLSLLSLCLSPVSSSSPPGVVLFSLPVQNFRRENDVSAPTNPSGATIQPSHGLTQSYNPALHYSRTVLRSKNRSGGRLEEKM